MDIIHKVVKHIEDYETIQSQLTIDQASMKAYNDQMIVINKDAEMLEKATLAIQQVRPLLAASSIKQCEELANSAIESIFGFNYKVEYDVEDGRFMLNKGTFSTDLAESEGGGIIAVISFVFQVYLLVKLEKRKFLAFDEAFVQISDLYFPQFIEFVSKLCKDLEIDILLITHDQRIEEEMVDHDYLIKDGIAIKRK